MTRADEYIGIVLDQMPPATPRRRQIGDELRSHIAERLATGRSVDDVLRQLGDPVALAESYLAEVPLVPAPFGRRIAAKLLDIGLFLAGFGAIVATGYLAARVGALPDAVQRALPLLLPLHVLAFVLLYIAYMVVAEWQTGQTLGKYLFGLRAVRESGARIGLGQSLVRQLPYLFQVFWIDALFAFFTDRRQRAFELLSKTRVVDELQPPPRPERSAPDPAESVGATDVTAGPTRGR